MATITFKFNDKEREIYQNDSFVEEYSDYPEELTKIIRELDVLTCDLSRSTAPCDGTQHLMSHVRLGYRGRELRFDFYHSIRNTEEWGIDGLDSEFLKDVLHKLLHSVRSDVNIYEFGYEEFLENYGQASDIRKTYKVYLQCLAHSKKIMRVFSDDEIATFPY